MLENYIEILLAREQTALLLGGFVLILLGGAVLVDFLLVLKRRIRLKAKITGIRIKSGQGSRETPVYFPVVEYTTPAGKKARAESDSGSSNLTTKPPCTESAGVFLWTESPTPI